MMGSLFTRHKHQQLERYDMMFPKDMEYDSEEDFIILIIDGMDGMMDDEEEDEDECGCPKPKMMMKRKKMAMENRPDPMDPTYDAPHGGKSQYSMPKMEDKIRKVIQHLLM